MRIFNTCKHSNEELAALRSTLEKLATSQKALEMEWDLVYDKLRQLTGRLTKRAAIMEAQSATQDEAEPDAVDGAPTVPTEPLLGLSKRQNAINDAILRQRRVLRA